MRLSTPLQFGISTLAVAALVATGCSDSAKMTSNPAGSGQVRMILGGGGSSGVMAATSSTPVLGDGSGRTIQSATITLSSVLARNLDGQLINVTMDLTAPVDLVALLQGGTVNLPMGSLPAGTYDQLVVVIRTLHVVLSDGTQLDVTPPGGGWTAIVPATPFDVVAGQMTTVTLQFQANGAFQFVNGQLVFNPNFSCQTDHQHGSGGGDDDNQGGHD
jgi:hypothetical protein